MTPEEWAGIATTIPQTWPRVKFTNDDALAWYKALRDLDGGYVALALHKLSRAQKFAPAVAEVRSIAQTEQANARRGQLLAAEEERATGRYMTFAQWRAENCPSIEAWGLTVADVDRLFPRGFPVHGSTEEVAGVLDEARGAA